MNALDFPLLFPSFQPAAVEKLSDERYNRTVRLYTHEATEAAAHSMDWLATYLQSLVAGLKGIPPTSYPPYIAALASATEKHDNLQALLASMEANRLNNAT